MLLQVCLLFVGFILLIKGADWFVDGASSLASLLKVPSVVVGLTIVAFGTSAPEAAVSITAGLNGSNAIAVSNVIGSNIFNLLMVLGVTALIANVPVTRSIVRREFPFLIIISIIMVLMICFDFKISHIEGLILFIGVIGYVIWLIKDSISKRASMEVSKPAFSLPISIVLMIVGIAGIIIGGNLVVSSSKAIALAFGLSEKLVGLTIVSIGTSLPELVTSVVAARKGEVDIAIGNVVGSNIFNILFILGASSAICAITVESAMIFDLGVMLVATFVCFFISKYIGKFTKREGLMIVLLFALYLAYIVVRN